MEYDLDLLASEQDSLVLSTFDYDMAWRIGACIREAAAAAQLPIAIEVTHGLDTVFLAILPGATYDNAHWTRRKIAAAHQFHRSSLYLRLAAEGAGYDFNQRFRVSTSDFAASGGAVPLVVRNAGLVGVAAVSGLPDVDDHRLVVNAIRATVGTF